MLTPARHLLEAETRLRDPGDVTDERNTSALLAIAHALCAIARKLPDHDNRSDVTAFETSHPNPFGGKP